jgi:hypothetical protein
MPRLHVIYDRESRMEVQQLPKYLFKVAMMDLGSNLDNDTLEATIDLLVTMLMEQVRADE